MPSLTINDLKLQKEVCEMKLYVLRHGETAWNTRRRLQGQSDILLDEEGIRLAALTGQGMKEIPIDLVISSPLLRARQTAELVMYGRDLPLLTDRRIMEMSFGDWEGESILDSTILPADFEEKFYHDPMHAITPPGGETFAEVLKRTKEFYESLCKNEQYADLSILISTHGAAGRCFMNNFFEDKEDIWHGGVPKNCAVSIVDVRDGVGTIEALDKIFYDDVQGV